LLLKFINSGELLKDNFVNVKPYYISINKLAVVVAELLPLQAVKMYQYHRRLPL
jgi:hypothetical protein